MARFPSLRPASTQPRDPCAHPRARPPAACFERTLAEYLPAAAAARSFRKFLAKNSLSLLTQGAKGSRGPRGGAPASLPGWALLLSARVAFLPGPERAWAGGCAGVSEAPLPARCPAHPSPGARALALPSPAFPRARRGPRRPAARRGAAPGAQRNEWRPDGRTEVAGATAGSRPARPGGPGSKFSAGIPARKVRCDKFRSGRRSCGCLGAGDREGSGTGWCRSPALRLPVPSLPRVTPLPVILAFPLVGSRISLLFVHGDPLWGKRRCEASFQTIERMAMV